ncbi:hypothetical protein BLSTO_04051, partial [Blastocystis sp. subtype 1]
EADFSRFRELKELVFGANSFVNVGSLELVGLHKLERLRFEVGAFANGFNLVLDDLPSLGDVEYSEGCFAGEPSGRRLAEASGYELRISFCASIRRVVIPGGSFTHMTVVSMVSLSAVEEVTIEEGALPKVEVMNMTEIQNVTRISIAPGSLEVCETLVMVDVAIRAENVKDVLEVSRECLKSLNRVMVNSVGSMIELVEDLKEKLGKDVEVDVVTPTSVVPTSVPTSVVPTVAPTTVAPTTVAPTTAVPTTVAPTTVAPTTVAPTTVAPTTVAPTTVAPTTMAPTFHPTPKPTPIPTQSPSTSKTNDCWSSGIPLNATEIVIPDNSCNGEEDGLDLSDYTELKKLTVGNNCFAKLESVDFSSTDSLLESITIGMNSFMGGNSNPDNILRIDDLNNLSELRIGRYSFSNYSLCCISGADGLEVLEIGNVNKDSFNFQYGSLKLTCLAMTSVSS